MLIPSLDCYFKFDFEAKSCNLIFGSQNIIFWILSIPSLLPLCANHLGDAPLGPHPRGSFLHSAYNRMLVVYIGTTLQSRFQINQTLPHAMKTYLLPTTIPLI